MVLVIFAKAMQRLEKLVKYVPFGHQKAPFGRFSLPNHRKIRGFRGAKGRKTTGFKVGPPKATTVPQKGGLPGKHRRWTWGAGNMRVFAPNPSRTRGKARFLPAFPVDPGWPHGGRMLARAVMHFEDILGDLTRRGGLLKQRGGFVRCWRHATPPHPEGPGRSRES